jgi:DNA-binding transcriptional LysR family regulator
LRLEQLVLFCRVYEEGTVTAAAAALPLSQPAASMQLRELERVLGVALFRRKGRRLVPTEAATVFYAYASTIARVWQEAVQAVAAVGEGRAGQVAVGASTTGVMYHLPPLLRAFRAEVPEVRLTLECANTDRVVAWLVHRRVDVGLVWGPVTEPGVTAETLLRASFALILPPDHPLAVASAGTGVVAPEALRGIPFVLQQAGTSTRRFVEEALGRVGVRPQEAAVLDSTEEVKQGVEAGLGAAVVAARAAEREAAAGVLAVRQIAGCDLGRPLVLATRAEGPGSPAAERFVAFVRARGPGLLAGSPGGGDG